MYDPLGILNDAKPKKGQQQVDPLGILPVKKKELGGILGKIGGTVGVSNGRLEEIQKSDDPVKDLLSPAREQYKNAMGNYLSSQNEGQHSDMQGMNPPIIANMTDVKQQENPSDITKLTQEHNKAANNLVVTHDLIKNSLFKNGNVAKKVLQNASSKGKIDPNNETLQLASDKANEIDKVYNDYQSSHSIAASAINEAMQNDENFASQVKQLKGKLPPALEGAAIDNYIRSHKNDLEELSKTDRSLGTDYEDLKDNLEQRYPDYGMTVIANKLSKEREKAGYNSSIANFNTSTFQKHNDELASKILTPQEKTLYDKHKQDVAEMIDTGGALNRLSEGVESGLKGMAGSAKDVLGQTDKASHIYEQLNDEATNVSNGEKGWKKVIGETFHMGGTLLPLMAGGEIGEGLGLAPSTASGTAMTLQFGHGILKDAESKYPDDPNKAALSGLSNLIAWNVLPDLVPAGKVKDAFKEVKPELEKTIEDIGENETLNSVRNKLGDAFRKALPQYVKGVSEMTGLQVYNSLFDKLSMNDESFHKFHNDSDVGDVVKSMMAANILPAGMVGAGELINRPLETKPEEIQQPDAQKEEVPQEQTINEEPPIKQSVPNEESLSDLKIKSNQLQSALENPPTRDVSETNDEGESTGKVIKRQLKPSDLEAYKNEKQNELDDVSKKISDIESEHEKIMSLKPKLDDLPFLKEDEFDKAKSSDQMSDLADRQKGIKQQFKNLRKIADCIWAI